MRLSIYLAMLVVACVTESSSIAAENAGVSAERALQILLEGNTRYVEDRAKHPDARPSDAAQHPLAVMLSCSDSRVPPEIAFDQGVGKLFIVRVAGNTYDRLALESIEYAVSHLGAKLIVVMGHDQCGAVGAAVKAYPDPKVGPMLSNIYPAVAQAQKEPGDVTSNAISANAVLIAERLRREPALAETIKTGRLKIVPARYALATGKVSILKAH
jgi:carbonic anhydrase